MTVPKSSSYRGWYNNLEGSTLDLYVGYGGASDPVRLLYASTSAINLLKPVTNTFSTVTAAHGFKTDMTFTATTAIGGRGVVGQVTYTPATAGSGGAVPVGVYAKTILSSGCTSTLYMWGVQAQLDFDGNSVMACSQVAALRAVLTAGATPTITSGHIAAIYCDNLISADLSDTSNYADMVRLANHGGSIDNMINFYLPYCTNLFRFDGITSSSPIGSNASGGGTLTFTNWRKIQIDIEGTVHYMLAARAIA